MFNFPYCHVVLVVYNSNYNAEDKKCELVLKFKESVDNLKK